MNTPKISLIAALSENRVIGKNNKLPWHIADDLKRFRRITSGHVVIMGRKTYDSIGRPLPDRVNIVVTRDENYINDQVQVAHSVDEAVEMAREEEMKRNVPDEDKEIFILGGGQIFDQMISKADKLYLTVVHRTLDGDTHFPDYSSFTKEVYRKEGKEGEYSFTFLDLER